ncbi:uncharacterized protein At1g24485-like isoform X2 [Cornus florida]|uniref:uncharacterized protein At1g24485-like isoform X2 n=1 Tax=Cornus florida TaxID=4283 RepID=UPI00289A0D71|nr:uncharacterized protein At1g24485-like isoform X2 [Cornus florida]
MYESLSFSLSMDRWKTMAVLLLVLFAPKASSYGRFQDLCIDCGAYSETPDTNKSYILWQTDEKFIKTGDNKFLSSSHTQFQMNTLRFFPKGRKNCYTLPFYDVDAKYFFRAGFYYGNYDGLSNPPSFYLEIDGNLWANVTTSMSEEMIYYELLYVTKKSRVRVCLIRTMDSDVPIITSLEAYYIIDAYEWMDNTTTLYLHSRINYGADTSVEQSIDPSAERYNRIWKSKELSNYVNIHANYISHYFLLGENRPPWPVMGYAIQSQNLTDSIYLSIDFSPRTAVQAYFVLYFMDPVSRLAQNQTSSVEIYIDNNKMVVTDIPNINSSSYNQFHVVTLFFVPVNGSSNVIISPAEGITLAPLLNAIEVFSAIDVSEGGHLFKFSSVLFIISFHFLLILVT